MGESDEPLSATQAWEHWDAMVAAARGVLRNGDEAADAAMAAMVQVLERPPSGVVNREAYLVTISKRRAVDHVRKQVRLRRDDDALMSASDIAEAVCDQQEAVWVARTARELLPSSTLELFERLADGASVVESASAMKITVRAAEGLVRRGRQLMNAAMARTLAILTGLVALARRCTRPLAAAPVLAAAVMTAMVVMPDVTVSRAHQHVGAPTLLPVTAPLDGDRSSSGAALTATGATRTRLTERAGSGRPGGAAATGRTNVHVFRTPVGTVTTYQKDDGYRSRNVVDRLGHCLSTLSLQVRYVGCS